MIKYFLKSGMIWAYLSCLPSSFHEAIDWWIRHSIIMSNGKIRHLVFWDRCARMKTSLNADKYTRSPVPNSLDSIPSMWSWDHVKFWVRATSVLKSDNSRLLCWPDIWFLCISPDTSFSPRIFSIRDQRFFRQSFNYLEAPFGHVLQML